MSLSKQDFRPTDSGISELNPFIRPETKELLAELLHHNHESHHCFFNTKAMHNHAAHQMIAGLTVGATPEQLQKHYDYQLETTLNSFSLSDRKAYDPFKAEEGKDSHNIEKVTDENWTKHAGNARYYWSYLHFFSDQIAKHGIPASLERFIFDKEANKPDTLMLVRFYGGVLHALIHCGYGVEFNMTGIVAEGLAMATSTAADHAWLFDQSWLHSSPTSEKKRLLPIVQAMLKDDRLSSDSIKLRDETKGLPDTAFIKGGSAHGLIHQYADQWEAVQSSEKINAEMAIQDLSLLSALLFGAVPKNGDAYHHDFFLMHLNNAHLFTSVYLKVLKPKTQVILLRALVAHFLYYWIARGRPTFSVANWIQESEQAADLDWPGLFQEAAANIDEHCVKAVRTLYVFSQQSKGHPIDDMVSAQLIDGSQAKQLSNGQHADPYLLTARQIVRMHQGKITPSKHSGDLIGADTEFWDFDKFLPSQ